MLSLVGSCVAEPFIGARRDFPPFCKLFFRHNNLTVMSELVKPVN